MEVVIKRDYVGKTCTIGSMLIDGVFECFTLEDLPPGKEGKIYGKTRIPAGRYSLVITHSPKFGVFTPYLLGVPGFSEIRIHSGNTAKDTEGCILVGALINDDGESLLKSRVAYNRLFPTLDAAIKSGEKVTVEILNEMEE